MLRKTLRCLTALSVLVMASGRMRAEDLTVLKDVPDYAPAKQMLQRYLRGLANEAFDRRREKYESLKNSEQIAAYQNELRQFFIEQIGGLPKQTPLNAKTVGRVDGERHRVEKVVFESQPQHFVTAILYLPKSKPPHPGVIVPCGHTPNGKAADAYQRLCILLARNGIAALCYDPVGQGERYQILDDKGKPRFKSTTEHTLVGVGSILVGRNTASYRIWDGMRALDYLASRKEIDSERLGCTGNSGGGTLTEYLMALDPRIKCAVPSCCVTTFERRLETIGPGDAEQNIFGQIAFGMDHADYTLMRAPLPTLLATATHDFVDIEGSWHIFRDAKRLYTRIGFAERVDLIEVDGKHGYSQLKREAAVRWMRRWLLGKDDPITEPEFDVLPASEIQCLPRGQAQLEKGARSVIDLNVTTAEEQAKHRRELWQPTNRDEAIASVRQLAGICQLSELPKPKVEKAGVLSRDDYEIEKLTLETQPRIGLPSLLFRPTKPSGRRVLYLHDDGKHIDAAEGGPIESLVREGVTVLAVDVRGIGETGSSSSGVWGGNWNDIFLSYLLGKSMLGMRAEDTLVAAWFLAELDIKGEPNRVDVVAIGQVGPPAIHAVALEQSLFGKLTLRGSTTSWLPVLRDPTIRGQLVNVVHGALKSYDLADLLASLPAESLKIESDNDAE